MQWWDVYVQVLEHVAEEVSAYLWHIGSQGVVVYDRTALSGGRQVRLDSRARAAAWAVLYAALPIDATLPLRLCALQQYLDTCPKPDAGPHWQLYCRPSQEADLAQWQQFFPPLDIEQRLIIHPPWEIPDTPSGMERLQLDPGLAFGTGLHPTTRMCLTILARRFIAMPGGALLDVGCGSGILSLAALKLGADVAVGVDVDPRAIGVAAQNAVDNALQERIQFHRGSLEVVEGLFACIVANIYLGPLVEMMPVLAQRLAPQGQVILSGILDRQEADLQRAMQTAGLRVQQRRAEAGWVALAGQHARTKRSGKE